MLREIPAALITELRSLDARGRRGTDALAAALSVVLAVSGALLVHSDEPWWAVTSAWMLTRSSLTIALSRGVMRVVGSAVGATVAVIVVGLFVYEPLPFCLCLFTIAWIGLFGFATSSHGSAWLVSAITANLVMLMALDQPQAAFTIAVHRVADLTMGTGSALLVTFLLPALPDAPAGITASAPSALPLLFWSRRNAQKFECWLHDNGPLISHACRGGLTVMLLPLLLNWLPQLSPGTMALSSVAVMAIPTTAILEPDGRTVVQRAEHQLVGCALGALLGLFCLRCVGSDFPVWLLFLMVGTWLSSQIQSGSAGISYVGAQAGLAFLLSMIQGQGPPVSPTPGLHRFAGIMAALSVLLIITMVISLFRPAPSSAPPAGGD